MELVPDIPGPEPSARGRRPSGRWIRALLVLAAFAAAVVGPTWLWFRWGRKLPLVVAIDATAYVADPGQALTLRARTQPSEDVALSWHCEWIDTPFTGHTLKIAAPKKAGVYHVRLRGRRAGSQREDEISLTVEPTPAVSPRHTLSTTPAACASTGTAVYPVRLYGRPCRGANIVAEIKGTGDAQFWHKLSPGGIHRRGRLANLRLPNADSRRLMLSSWAAHPDRRCSRPYQQPITLADCQAGPAATRFAEFAALRTGPGAFRFVAKPPRDQSDPVRYHWQLGNGVRKSVSVPVLAYRYAQRAEYRLVRLEVQTKRWRRQTLRAVWDPPSR